MKRKRSTPWIHRWSRPIMAGIATVGAVGTAYLTVTKFNQGTAALPYGWIIYNITPLQPIAWIG